MENNETQTCPKCFKDLSLCICDSIRQLENKTRVLILQHPQEPDKELGTAKLANLILKNSKLKTCFSIPNLMKAEGTDVNPANWIVLFLGSKYKLNQIKKNKEHSEIIFFNKKGEEVSFDKNKIEGIVLLDGTWAQAKTLWWRNPWLVKLKRVVIFPKNPSLYGKLRKEPRKECLSTIESIAYSLEILGEDKEIVQELFSAFKNLLDKYNSRKLNQNQS